MLHGKYVCLFPNVEDRRIQTFHAKSSGSELIQHLFLECCTPHITPLFPLHAKEFMTMMSCHEVINHDDGILIGLLSIMLELPPFDHMKHIQLDSLCFAQEISMYLSIRIVHPQSRAYGESSSGFRLFGNSS